MPKNLIFKDAEKAKQNIMASQQKEIVKLYEDWADEIRDRANFYSHKTTASAPVSERYYKELQKQLRKTSQEISNEIYGKIKSNIYTISDAVVSDNIKWLESFGFSQDGLNAAFSYVPMDTVQNLITGQIYDSGWSLSRRIWGDNEQTLKDIYQVMARGLAENKPIYEIAKDLESYVRPNARLPWNLRMADGKKIYKKQVDYNAQRLARTLVQHGYQQSFLAVTQKNPFITEYIWSSNGSRVCPLCASRNGTHYKKDELPLDHPNGMCTMIPVVVDDMVDRLADWVNSPDGTYPDIDDFAGNFGYKPQKIGTVQGYINKYGMSSKSPNSWYSSLTPTQKAEAKALKEQSGLTWNKWYEQNIYNGDGSNLNTTKKSKKKAKAFSSADWYNSIKNNDMGKFESWCDDWLKNISRNEREGVHIYTSDAYIDMNNYLRKISSDTSYKDEIDWCTEALRKAKLPEDVIVRRGSDYNMLKELGSYEMTEQNKNRVIGGLIRDKGFMSTSPSPNGGFSGNIEYVIKVPKGSQAMYVANISAYESEQELLINRGGKFMIEDVEFNQWGDVKKIYMTLVNLQNKNL